MTLRNYISQESYGSGVTTTKENREYNTNHERKVIGMHENMEINSAVDNIGASGVPVLEKAKAKLLQHDITEAYEILVETMKTDHENNQVLNLIARCYFIWGDFTRAELSWRRVLELDAKNTEASLSLEDLNDSYFQSWLKRYYDALKQVESRNYKEARKSLWELLQEKDCFVGLYQLLGLCYIAEADHHTARKVWSEGLKRDLSNKPLLSYLDIYREDIQDRVMEGEAVDKKWIHWPAPPGKKATWLLSGLLCTVLLVQGINYLVGQKGNIPKRTDIIQQQAKHLQEEIGKGDYVQMVMAEKRGAGQVAEEGGNNIGVENTMAGADYDVEQEKWYYCEGYQAYLEGNYKKAASNLGMVVSMQSKTYIHREALYYLARVYYLNSDYKNAEKYFSDYIRDFPSSNYYDESLFYLACIYHHGKQEDKAIKSLETLRDTIPDSGYLSSKIAKTILGN